jgi:hypothetical protein
MQTCVVRLNHQLGVTPLIESQRTSLKDFADGALVLRFVAQSLRNASQGYPIGFSLWYRRSVSEEDALTQIIVIDSNCDAIRQVPAQRVMFHRYRHCQRDLTGFLEL